MNAFAGKRVFILDSSHLFLNTLKADLQAKQCLVETATSSAAALMRIIRWHPDLIITGVEVGEITGFDLCLLLNLIPDSAGTPVIVMSSNESELMSRKVADAGGDFYVHKDAHLIPAIHEIMGKLFPAATQPEASPPAIRRVLVVDDSKMMRRVIRNILNSVGLTDIVEAGNGAEALRRLEESPVDLVMTDWNMPVMSGIEFVRAVRAQPRFAKISIVMVTTESSRDSMAEAKAAGINGHLRKPFNRESMKELILRFHPAA